MEYEIPLANPGPNESYKDGNPSTETPGSRVPAAAIENGMRELHNLIEAAGLTPTREDLTQVEQAVKKFTSRKVKILELGTDYQISDTVIELVDDNPPVNKDSISLSIGAGVVDASHFLYNATTQEITLDFPITDDMLTIQIAWGAGQVVDSGSTSADLVSYDNSLSDLDASTVQEALDDFVEVVEDLQDQFTNSAKGLAKVFVCFNGTGTVSIKQAMNVASITDNGTGDYTLNFSNNMSDGNYACVIGGPSLQGGNTVGVVIGVRDAGSFSTPLGPTVKTDSQLRISVTGQNGSQQDMPDINVTIFGDLA